MNSREALSLLDFNYKRLESPIAFANLDLIYEYFKDSLTKKQIKEYLETLPEYTKQRKFIQKFNRNYIFTPYKRYLLQSDLKV